MVELKSNNPIGATIEISPKGFALGVKGIKLNIIFESMIVWLNDDPKGKNKYAYQLKELMSTLWTASVAIWYYLDSHKSTLYNQMKLCNPYSVSLHFCPIFILSLPIFLFYYNKRENKKALKFYFQVLGQGICLLLWR